MNPYRSDLFPNPNSNGMDEESNELFPSFSSINNQYLTTMNMNSNRMNLSLFPCAPFQTSIEVKSEDLQVNELHSLHSSSTTATKTNNNNNPNNKKNQNSLNRNYGRKRKHPAIASTSPSSTDSSSSSSEIVITQGTPSDRQQKMTNARTSGYVRALHVWKKDIRRKYQEMYSNVINSHDAWLFTKFLQEFAHPVNCQFTITIPSNSDKPVTLCNGVSDVVYGYTLIHLKLPDAVHSLEDTTIHVPHSGEGSRIVSNMTFHGTRLFEFQGDALAEEIHRAAGSSSSSSFATSHSSSVTEIVDEMDDGSISSTEEMHATPTIQSEPIGSSSSVSKGGPPSITDIPINAAEQLLLPALSFKEVSVASHQLQKKQRQETNSAALLDSSMEEDLITRFQSLQLYRINQPKDVVLKGTLTLALNSTHQIEGIHFKVQYVQEQNLQL